MLLIANAAVFALYIVTRVILWSGIQVPGRAEQLLQELPLELPQGRLDEAAATDLAQRFDTEYARLYGEGARAVFQAREVFAIRVAARVPLGFAPEVTAADGNGAAPAAGRTRDVFWPEERARLSTAVHDGSLLGDGDTIAGPAVVELPHTAVAVPAGHELRRDTVGNLVLTVT